MPTNKPPRARRARVEDHPRMSRDSSSNPHGPITEAIRAHEAAGGAKRRHPLYDAKFMVWAVVEVRVWHEIAEVRARLDDVRATLRLSAGHAEELRHFDEVARELEARHSEAATTMRGKPAEAACRVRDGVIAELVNATPWNQRPEPQEIAYYLHEITGERLTAKRVSAAISDIITRDERREEAAISDGAPPRMAKLERQIRHPQPKWEQTPKSRNRKRAI